ncbi:UNVERIFIED_CONTAM: tRNase Z TRZ1 [Sesamum radiatum]|uniref:TRNase Z TRZ1 n=1 Tax=Sesamum radiatum TaxID=300843 RepID=A0AAW2WGY2_SESRA
MASSDENASKSIDIKAEKQKKKKKAGKEELKIEGYSINGLSIAGHETCVILPGLNLAFDIGKCPQRAISQQFLFISHGHMDHIGGLPMYVATRGLYRMAPPTVFVPKVIKGNVEKIFEAHRAMDQSELNHTLIGLDVGEEFRLRKDLIVRAFKTYHVIPSQVVVKARFCFISFWKAQLCLEDWLIGFGFNVGITDTYTSPEVAFTGDTMSDFIIDPENVDVLKAKLLILESTYVEDTCTVEDARDYGHTHLSEIINYADKFENKAILLIHFSARYQLDVIENAVSALPPPLAGRVFALTNGF